MSTSNSFAARAFRAALAAAVVAIPVLSGIGSGSEAEGTVDPCVARAGQIGSKLPKGCEPSGPTSGDPVLGTTTTTVPCVDPAARTTQVGGDPCDAGPTTSVPQSTGPSNNTDHGIRLGEVDREVHVFVVGDSWARDVGAPKAKPASHLLEPQASETYSNREDWGEVADALTEQGYEVAEVYNYALGGLTAKALDEDSVCTSLTELAVLADDCPSGSTSAQILTDRFANDLQQQISDIPSNEVPLIYLSIGANDLWSYQSGLNASDPAARADRLDTIERHVASIATKLRSYHDRAEILIPGYAGFNLPYNHFLYSAFTFPGCTNGNGVWKNQMLNALMTGGGTPEASLASTGSNPDCIESDGLDGIYRRLDRPAGVDPDNRIMFPGGANDENPGMWNNWGIFHEEPGPVYDPSAHCIVHRPGSSPIFDGFHLVEEIVGNDLCENGRDHHVVDGAQYPRNDFALEVVCDWRIVTQAFAV